MAGTLLSINNYHYARGGAEVVFLQHNGMLSTAGWSVVPFCMQHERNDPSDWSPSFVEEIELDGRPDRGLAKVRKGLKAVYSFEARKKVRDLLARIDPDICHAHNVYHHLSPSILAAIREHDVPLVMTLHDLKLACPAYKMLAPDGVCERCRDGRLRHVVEQRCMKGSRLLSLLVMLESYLHRYLRSYLDNVDCFIVPSHFYIEKFVEWGFERSRFRYVPNFVDSAHYPGWLEPGSRFVFVGRLSPEKGVATLLEAAILARVGVDVVGTGPAEADLRKLATKRGCDARFHGYLTGPALRNAIASARAVVVPSEWYENAPLSVLEACALGKPVIVSAIGGLPELVHPNETGWTFPAGSATALAERLQHVAALPNKALKTVGATARALVARDFSPGRYLEGIRAVYSSVGVAW